MASHGSATVTLSRMNVRPVMTMIIPAFEQKGQPMGAILFHRPLYCMMVFILLLQFRGGCGKVKI